MKKFILIILCLLYCLPTYALNKQPPIGSSITPTNVAIVLDESNLISLISGGEHSGSVFKDVASNNSDKVYALDVYGKVVVFNKELQYEKTLEPSCFGGATQIDIYTNSNDEDILGVSAGRRLALYNVKENNCIRTGEYWVPAAGDGNVKRIRPACNSTQNFYGFAFLNYYYNSYNSGTTIYTSFSEISGNVYNQDNCRGLTRTPYVSRRILKWDPGDLTIDRCDNEDCADSSDIYRRNAQTVLENLNDNMRLGMGIGIRGSKIAYTYRASQSGGEPDKVYFKNHDTPILGNAVGGNYIASASDVTVGSDDAVYVIGKKKTDTSSYYLMKFAQGLFTSDPIAEYQLNNPLGIGSDEDGNVYVTDTKDGTNVILKFNQDLTIVKPSAGVDSSVFKFVRGKLKDAFKSQHLNEHVNFILRTNAVDPINSVTNIENSINAIAAPSEGEVFDSISVINQAVADLISKPNCRPNILILITNGESVSDSNWTALQDKIEKIKNDNSIVTMTIQIGSESTVTDQLNALVEKGQNDDSPVNASLFLASTDDILTKLTDYINYSFKDLPEFSVAEPTIHDGYLYKTSFKYKPFGQWEGSLKKIELTTGNIIWDQAQLLKNRDTTRDIKTAANNNHSYRFVSTNAANLKSLLFPGSASATTEEAEKLINFIHGFDSYDENGNGNITEKRESILADIYHSKPIILSKPNPDPSFYNEFQKGYWEHNNNYRTKHYDIDKNRKEFVLVGSNTGLLHAFDVETGEEKFAYIPPSLLNKLQNMISDIPGRSKSIYGVDGTPVAFTDYKYPNAHYYTRIVVGMGLGGNSYAEFLENNYNSNWQYFRHFASVENQPEEQLVKFWNEIGISSNKTYALFSRDNGTAYREYNYSRLGKATSTPKIFYIQYKDKSGNEGPHAVMVFGSGYHDVGYPHQGAAVFVRDIWGHNGNMNQTSTGFSLLPVANPSIHISETDDGIINGIPSDVTVINSDSAVGAQYQGAIVYATDLEGKVTKIDLTESYEHTTSASALPTFARTTLFDAAATSTNQAYVFQNTEAKIVDEKLWLYFGTGNIKNIHADSNNKIYGIKDINWPSVTSTTISTIANCTNTYCPTTEIGWYRDLPNNQKLIANPSVHIDGIYFSVYEPDADTCVIGNAKLLGQDDNCGNTLTYLATCLSSSFGTGISSTFVNNNDALYAIINGTMDSSCLSLINEKDANGNNTTNSSDFNSKIIKLTSPQDASYIEKIIDYKSIEHR